MPLSTDMTCHYTSELKYVITTQLVWNIAKLNGKQTTYFTQYIALHYKQEGLLFIIDA